MQISRLHIECAVNWHKMFSRFKARHGGSAERNYDGKITANLFPRRQYD